MAIAFASNIFATVAIVNAPHACMITPQVKDPELARGLLLICYPCLDN